MRQYENLYFDTAFICIDLFSVYQLTFAFYTISYVRQCTIAASSVVLDVTRGFIMARDHLTLKVLAITGALFTTVGLHSGLLILCGGQI